MKKIRTFLIAAFLICFLAYFSSCQKDEDYNYFRIQVDSVYIPESVLASQPFEVEFYGIVGYNGCYSFEKFVSDKQNKTILVEALGKYNVNSVCPTVMVYLNGKKIEFLLEEAGSYKLRIKQPEGTFLERQFWVE